MPEDTRLKYLSIHLDESGKKIIASFAPEGDTNAITPGDLMQAINAAGFGGYSIHKPTLADAATKYNSGKPFEIMVGEAVDGKFSIHIDPHLMAAYLNCTLPLGGAPVQPRSIQQEAEQKGITVPLDAQAIDKALREGGNNILIASGKPPVQGIDGKLEVLLPSMKEKHPHLDEHGLADFRDLGEIVTVHANDKLMRLVLPTAGEPGQTVTGKPIPVKPGKKIAFAAKLDGAVLDANDPNVLLAAVDGCPTILKDGVSVDPVYNAENVDLHTGNIIFKGTVHIAGDVHADMVIKASGDIYVDGTVESAMLDAGGDIVIKGGVIGASELHVQAEKVQAAINCDGSFTAHFVQNAHISAGNGIFIHDIAMLSKLTAGHQIVVGDEHSRKGEIIGGIIRAAMLVKAQNIGSPNYVKTVVIVGPDKLLYERRDNAIKTREASENKLVSIVKLLEIARSSPGRVPPESVKTALAMRDALNAEIETLREEETELQKEIDIATKAQVIAEKHVFTGTEIYFGLTRFNATSDRQGGVFHMNDEGELVFV